MSLVTHPVWDRGTSTNTESKRSGTEAERHYSSWTTPGKGGGPEWRVSASHVRGLLFHSISLLNLRSLEALTDQAGLREPGSTAGAGDISLQLNCPYGSLVVHVTPLEGSFTSTTPNSICQVPVLVLAQYVQS